MRPPGPWNANSTSWWEIPGRNTAQGSYVFFPRILWSTWQVGKTHVYVSFAVSFVPSTLLMPTSTNECYESNEERLEHAFVVINWAKGYFPRYSSGSMPICGPITLNMYISLVSAIHICLGIQGLKVSFIRLLITKEDEQPRYIWSFSTAWSQKNVYSIIRHHVT